MTFNKLLHAVVSRKEITRIGLYKLFFSLLILLALVSHNDFDPSPFNLLQSVDGIANFLGLPGALFSGLLFETFGLMAWAIPLLFLFSGRRKESLSLRLVIPELIEIFALCSLVGLLYLPNHPNTLLVVGSWGALSGEVLTGFPGKGISLAVLLLYQGLYFCENRIDISSFYFFGLLLLIVQNVMKRFGNLLKQTSEKTIKYGVFNWITPFGTLILKSIERVSLKSRSILLNLRNRIGEMDVLGKVIDSIESLIYKKRGKPQPVVNFENSEPIGLNKLSLDLVATLQEYRKTYYLLDKKLFLKTEEEI
jgi:DNA translocase FtsK/SpoIIIE-like protein